MLQKTALSVLLLGTLAAGARAQAGGTEAAWEQSAARFDGILSPGRAAVDGESRSGSLGALKGQAGAAQAAKPAAQPPAAQAPAKPGEAKKDEYDPWAGRQDFGIMGAGIFGLALLGWQGQVRDVFWLTLGATIIIVGYFLISAVGL